MTKANIFMAASWAGLAGIALLIVNELADPFEGLGTAGALLTLLGGFVAMFTRRADEYTQGLWNAGASTAFASLLILFIGLPFFEGAYDGLSDKPKKQDIDPLTSVVLAICAFYVGLFWRRFRGGF